MTVPKYRGRFPNFANRVMERLERSPNPAWAVDEEQRIRFMNRSCEEALGVAADEAMGQECWRVLPSLTSRSEALCRLNCAPILEARAGACPVMTLMRVRRPTDLDEWLTCSFTVLDEGGSAFLMLHTADWVTEVVQARSLLSDYMSRVSGLKGVSRGIPARQRRPKGVGALSFLSPRELEVLRCIGDGLKTKQIANKLSLRENTVRNYVKRTFSKLDCHSRLEAVAILNAASPK